MLLTIPEIPHAGIILSYISTKPAPPEETFMMESGLLSLQKKKSNYHTNFKWLKESSSTEIGC